MYYLHLLLVRLHRNRGVRSAFNALYGLHLMPKNRGTDCTISKVRTAQFLRLIFSTEIEEIPRQEHLFQARVSRSYSCIYCRPYSTVLTGFSGSFRHRNREQQAAVHAQKSRLLNGFGDKLNFVLYFSAWYFAEEIKISLSLTGFPRGGFSRAD